MKMEEQMLKTRAMPILASAAVALSLAACQGMGGGEAGGRQQASATEAGQRAQQAQAQQALAPDLVRNIQRTLSQRGYDAGPADGVYGESTQTALRNFQRDQRLTGSGQLDSQTLAALGVVTEGSRAATGPAQREYTPTSRRGAAMQEPRRTREQAGAAGLSSNQVRDLQQELSSRGYDPGDADGQWGPRTRQALRQFQQDQNLAASGRPDQRTLAALGIEGAGIQTGAVPPGQPEEMQRQQGAEPEGFREREETGQLPDTGSEAPGGAPESERMGATEGVEPDIRRGVPEPSGPEAEQPLPETR